VDLRDANYLRLLVTKPIRLQAARTVSDNPAKVRCAFSARQQSIITETDSLAANNGGHAAFAKYCRKRFSTERFITSRKGV
jgi:hypothetical protein